MRAELIPINGEPPILITRDITIIGRREYCDIQLDDPSLSKRHCVLVKTDGLLMVRDLATTNGTRVKGQMIRWAALLPNDRITLGKLKFRVFLGPDSSAAVAEPQPAKVRAAAQPTSKTVRPDSSALETVAPVVGLAELAKPDRDHPRIDVDDSRWFDRMGAENRGEGIFDLD